MLQPKEKILYDLTSLKGRTAVLAFPTLASEISATRSPTEFAQARNVNPIIVVGIFHITPSAVNKPTTSFASVNIFFFHIYHF